MIRHLTLAAALSSGLAAGIFYAFSSFVMKGLKDTPPAVGIQAMQGINRAAPTFWFMLVLIGTALLTVILAIAGFRDVNAAGAWLLIGGAALYLSAIVLTGAYHIPRNDALAALTDPTTPAAAEQWKTYLTEWTRMNHLRFVGPLGAAIAFTFAWRSMR